MKIELKGVKFYEKMSEETNAFVADIYVDGKKCGYAKNDGHGGETEIHSYPEQREKFRECEQYCKTLPPRTWEYQGKTHSFDSNIVTVVDNLFQEWLDEKEKKKLEKKMETCLIWGLPKGHYIMTVNYKRKLTDIPHEVLQSHINKYKKDFKDGEIYLNTNLVGYDL